MFSANSGTPVANFISTATPARISSPAAVKPLKSGHAFNAATGPMRLRHLSRGSEAQGASKNGSQTPQGSRGFVSKPHRCDTPVYQSNPPAEEPTAAAQMSPNSS